MTKEEYLEKQRGIFRSERFNRGDEPA